MEDKEYVFEIKLLDGRSFRIKSDKGLIDRIKEMDWDKDTISFKQYDSDSAMVARLCIIGTIERIDMKKELF